MATMEKNAINRIKEAQAKGENMQVRHLEGWRDARNKTIIDLYVQGKCKVSVAVEHGAKPKDHLAAMESGKVSLDDLIAAGVDLRKIEASRNRMAGQLEGKIEKMRAEQRKLLASAPKVAVAIVRKGGAVKELFTAGVDAKQKTATQIAADVAWQESDARAKAKKEREAARVAGIAVVLTEKEKAELLAKTAARDMWKDPWA